MGEAVARAADIAFLTNDNPRTEDPESIAADVLVGLDAGGMKPADGVGALGYSKELDRKRAIEKAIFAARPGDAIVICGKGHETYQIVGAEKRPFDDRVIARSALFDRAHADAVAARAGRKS
jgi:UDP-N-acetylmuramoyl-L-alanyl-D-glutamate--2,6-diaminopimelate ligase